MGAIGASPSARVLGRYVLHGELASGGMATVHLARLLGEAGFSRTVAIKRLHPQYAKDPEFVAMFVDEARLAARVRHPNVVPTLDVVSEDGEIFLVMEYVHGESLSRLLRALQATKKAVPPAIAATVMAGVLHGLHAAHEARSEKGTPLGIVHRDVSPQNVLVGVDGIGHVLDFGVAKASGRVQTTKEGQLKGKLSYMAPEQLEDGGLTRQSDVYAAAVVLWEMLTLRRLFDGDNEATILMKVIEGKIPPPSRFARNLPLELDAIVMRGLDKDPTNRWPTARDFAQALERAVPIASASEIGEWVQTIAHEELARRARKLSEIERGSVRLLASSELKSEPPPPDGTSTATPWRGPYQGPTEPAIGDSESAIRLNEPAEPKSQVSTISVSKSEHSGQMPARPSSGRGWFIAGGLAGLMVVALFVAFARWGIGPRDAASRTTTYGSSPASPPPPPPAASVAAPTDVPQPANTGTAAITDDRPPPAPAAAPPAPRPNARPAKTRTNDCDPPFTRDAQGHKHYKLQCL